VPAGSSVQLRFSGRFPESASCGSGADCGSLPQTIGSPRTSRNLFWRLAGYGSGLLVQREHLRDSRFSPAFELRRGSAGVIAEIVTMFFMAGHLRDDGSVAWSSAARPREVVAELRLQAFRGELDRCERILDLVSESAGPRPSGCALRRNQLRDVRIPRRNPATVFGQRRTRTRITARAPHLDLLLPRGLSALLEFVRSTRANSASVRQLSSFSPIAPQRFVQDRAARCRNPQDEP